MRPIISIIFFAALASTAAAQTEQFNKPDAAALINADFIAQTRKWLNTDIVDISIGAQNKRYADISQADIDALDKQWRAEREAQDQPLIAATLSNPLSVYLSRIQARSLGLYPEIFVMDVKGLNVGQSSITSDYWQGDEDKYQKTFAVAKDAIFIDEPEWDDDLKIWRVQLNMTLTDPSGANAIGAATVEVNLTELQRRKPFGS